MHSASRDRTGQPKFHRENMTSVPNVIPQYLTAFFASLMVCGIGSILGYSSPVGLLLTGNTTDSSLHLTSYQNNWFSSITNIGATFGCPLAGFCLDFFGRKGTILISFLPFIVGWTLIASAQNFYMLITGRILTGVYCSLIGISVPVFIGEFSSPHIRGRLGTFFHLMLTMGILLASLFGTIFDSFRLIAIACALPTTVGLFFMMFTKESPHYLLSLKKEKEAEDSFKFFRGKNYSNIEEEIEVIKISLEENPKSKIQCLDIVKKSYRKPFLICLGLMSLRQLMGINALTFNMASIFKETGSSISSNVASVIVFSAQLLGTGIELFTVDLKGRKILLQISALVMATSCVTLGVFFYLKNFHPSVSHLISWLPFVTVSSYLCSFNMGFGPIPFVMLGELFSPKAKRFSTSIATMSNWASSFLATIAFHPFQEIVHNFGAYWIFAGICFVGFIFSTFCVFETIGKSLLEINAHFERKEKISRF